jgi:class 3 adenylate cyclase/predicted ATPase
MPVDISTWLQSLGLERYESAFRENEISVAVIPELTDADLRELGLPMGPRKLLLKAIASLRPPADPPKTEPDPRREQRDQSPARLRSSTPQERRQLTVMFADLVGSTLLSTRLDPEDMSEVLRAYQNTVTAEIARVGGYVAKLMGDGILAYFGWPHAHEDDAERAVEAGLAAVAAVAHLKSPDGESLATRVGVATGLVVVGDLVGEGAAQEEAVVGETPNLAARLQAAADPGSVVIAAGTRRLLKGLFELRDLGTASIKGFSAPVSSFRVIRERPISSRFETQSSGLGMPMVGRDQEFALVLERWHQAVAGEGQAVLLVGEAGIGKSRLVQALLEADPGEERITLRYQCSPQHTGTALWPVTQQFGLAAGFDSADAEAEKIEKLKALLVGGDEEVAVATRLIAMLFGIRSGDGHLVESLSPHQQRARTLSILVGQLLELARKKPVMMVVEDAHWADPTTIELIIQCLDRVSNSSVLILVTSRPDNQPTFGGHPKVIRLTLNRLGRRSTEAIVAGMAGDAGLTDEVLANIAARTDGIPLFVEELTKAVLDTGEGAAVPASLHASLMARLDRVPEVKEVARLAACIGREFSYALLAKLSQLAASELQGALQRLAAAELVFRRGTPPDAFYTFKHALVRDAAYESLLKSSRQEVHARIVEALEEHFPEIAAEEPELLGRHCMDAGLHERAVSYWRQAGDQALARCAMPEAVAHLTTALKVLKRLKNGHEHGQWELAMQLALGRASIAARGFAAAETGRAYSRARELCSDMGDVPEYFPALYGQSVFHFQRGDLLKAHEVAKDLVSLAVERGDLSAQVTGHRMVGSALCQLGRFVESRFEFETALALYEPVRDRSSATVYAIDSRVMCLSWLAHLDAILGDPIQAVARYSAARSNVLDVAHPHTTAVFLAWGCIFHQFLRDLPGAREQAEATIVLATEQGLPLYRAAGMVISGWTFVDGEAEEGIAKIRQGLAAYAATGAEMWSPYFLGLLAEALGRAGHAQSGLDVVADGLGRVRRIGGRWIEAELHRLRGDLLLSLPNANRVDADACYGRSLAVARGQSAALWHLRTVTSRARLWCDLGKERAAVKRLTLALGQFPDRADTPDLSAARALLRTLQQSATALADPA